jgi:hypothetical protein
MQRVGQNLSYPIAEDGKEAHAAGPAARHKKSQLNYL